MVSRLFVWPSLPPRTSRKAWGVLLACVSSLVLALAGCTSHETAQHRRKAVNGAPSAPTSASTAPAALDLPRIPWEGGPAYWTRFRNAVEGGWSHSSFFPVVIWFNGISSDSEVRWDKAHGINTYIGMDASTDFSLFERNHVYWIGGRLNQSFDPRSGNWVGNFLDDETDGRYDAAAGRAHLRGLDATYAHDGKFNYANFTQQVIGSLDLADAEAYVNDFTDVVSVDMYWYTTPFCDSSPYLGDQYVLPVERSNCRTASSYGKTVAALRSRDAADGRMQPIWQFVEDLNGGPSGPFVREATGNEIRGAVMSSIINEARGIVYFNQSLSGPCQGGSILREAQVIPHFCGASQVQAMGAVDAEIHTLAPVINTQSYEYKFGPHLQTMLKTRGDWAYVFAMVDGSAPPGTRNFTLPRQIHGTSATALFEHRRLPVHDQQFSDSFASENSYHIYRIRISTD